MAIPWSMIAGLIGIFGVSFLGGYFLPQVQTGLAQMSLMFMQIMMMIIMFSLVKAMW